MVAQFLTCSRYASTSLSNVTLRKDGSSTFGEMDSVRFVGPIAPATKPGRMGSAAAELVARLARLARRGLVELEDDRLEAVVRLRDARAVEGVRFDEVRTRAEVLAIDVTDDVRLRGRGGGVGAGARGRGAAAWRSGGSRAHPASA